jgi:FeS assembly SUF system regulator
MTDYGTLILAYLAERPGEIYSASEVAADTKLAMPTVSKLLKVLHRADLVESFRGSSGGYALSRPARQITAAQILDALEGPVTLTECASANSRCQLEAVCSVGNSWQRINRRIRRALDGISLAQLVDPAQPAPAMNLADA